MAVLGPIWREEGGGRGDGREHDGLGLSVENDNPIRNMLEKAYFLPCISEGHDQLQNCDLCFNHNEVFLLLLCECH